MSTIIDQLLSEIKENGSIVIHKDLPKEQITAIKEMEAYGLIVKSGRFQYDIRDKGLDALRAGGFDIWLKARSNSSTLSTQNDKNMVTA